MTFIALLDIVSAVLFVAAGVLVLLPRRHPMSRELRGVVVVLVVAFLFGRVSNALQWSGLTQAIDPFEDFVQMAQPFLYFFIFFLMVSARRRAELTASEEKYRAITEQMLDIVFTTDVDGVVTYLSPSAQRTLARPLNEIVGRSFAELVVPEDREKALAGFRRTVRNEVTARSFFFRVQRPDGEMVYLELNGKTLWRDGVVIGTVGVVRDVTERRKAEAALRQSEERLALALQGANLGTWDWNVRTGDIVFDRRWAGMLGYELSEIEPKFETWRGLIHPDDAPGVLQRLDEHLAGRTENYEVEHRLRNKQGDWVWVLARGRVVERDAEGQPIRATGTHLNITPRKQAEEEKAKLEEQLRQATKMEAVGRLAGGVAHDFNNLLTSIIGNLSLARERYPNDQAVGTLLADIGHAADRAAQLTRQLLAFSRKQLIAPVVLDLNTAVRNIRGILSRLIGEDVRLETYLTDQPCMIKADPNQLDQIIINLAVNARDAMPDGGKLTIETAPIVLDEHYCRSHEEVQPGEYFVLTISDTGCGIAKENLPQVFEPFFTTKAKGEGSGLGLSMVLGIVRQHRGSISIYSEVNRGTTVRVYLPRSDGQAAGHTANDGPTPPTGNRETLLVVEDDPMVRKVTTRILRNAGYTLLVARDGAEALVLAEAHPNGIDLLFTDVVMPNMNGRELAERIQKKYPKIRVLFTSGYTENIIAHHGVLDEGTAFLSKPFSAQELAAKVAEVLRQAKPGTETPDPAK